MFPFFSLLVSIVVYISSFLTPVYAGSLSSAKVVISDSRAGQSGVAHTFSFVTGTTGTIKTIEMQYCTTPSGTCTTPNGMVTTSASQGSISGLGTSTTNTTANGTLILTVTTPASITTGTTISLPYGTITNPTSINNSFFVRVISKDNADAVIDSTSVAFAILGTNSLSVTADVSAAFDVGFAAVTTGSVNGQVVNITNSTATTIPFGSLSSGSPKVAAHDVTVSTNSQNGYAITVKSTNPPLVDGSNNIDNFTGPNSLPLTWTSPSGNSPNINTGFVGYTTEDISLCTGTANRFTGNKWAGFDTNAYEVACNTSPVISGETTRIGWQVEVNSTQPSGSYSGYIAVIITPTY